MAQIILSDTPTEFRAWLAAKPQNSIIGYPANAMHCPLCVYLAEAGMEMPRVLAERYGPYGGKELPLPPWAIRLVRSVDHMPLHWLTAGEVLRTLDGRERRHAHG